MKTERHFNFQERIQVLLVITGLCFLILVARLFYLQIYQGDKYKTLADDNRIQTRIVTAPRGQLLDRNGVILADNRPMYQAILMLSQVPRKELRALLERLMPLLGWTQPDIENLETLIKKHPRQLPLSLKKDLTWAEVATLELHSWTLPGIEVIETPRRFYPLGEIAAHLTGYVAHASAQEIEKDPHLAIPDLLIGKDGIEKIYEGRLQGQPGRKEIEVNARGQAVRALSSEAPRSGEDIRLTIDSRLQTYMVDVLRPYPSAAAVVMDAHTGEIWGLASVPGYDPNAFRGGISHESWKALQDNPYKPMTNKITQGLYGPASLMKIIDDLVAYDHPSIGHDFRCVCGGVTEIAHHRFHCWKKKGHGPISLVNALFKSCDVYYYELARKIGFTPLREMATKMGFGEKTGIDLPGEKKGFLPNPGVNTGKHRWYLGDTILFAIGQGRYLTTPLQWAVLLAEIVNGGFKIVPHLVPPEPKISPITLKISEGARRHTQESLIQSVNSPQGTAYKMRIPEERYAMGGKTGTSQVRRISAKERKEGVRSQESLEWKLRDHAFFVGFAPTHQPRFVVAVVVEHGGWGSSTAARVGRDILKKTQEIDT